MKVICETSIVLAMVCALLAGALPSSSAFVAPHQNTVFKAAQKSQLRMAYTEAYDTSLRIEGGSMKAWKVSSNTERVHVNMQTGGRPTRAEINLWHGPDYTPTTMKVYLEDGEKFPLNIVLKPKGAIDTVQVKNIAASEFPVNTKVGEGTADGASGGIYSAPDNLLKATEPILVQGAGAIYSRSFEGNVKRVAVAMTATATNNVKFYLELLHGPNNIKQSIEFYASNGYKTPFFAIFDTPGPGYNIRIKNDYPLEFPIHAYIQPLDV